MMSDLPETTRKVLAAQARAAQGEWSQVDTQREQAAFAWLELAGVKDAVVPFAADLAEVLPDKPLRIRRDFPRLLQLIKVCAILHQLQRERDADDRVIATLADYAMVREVVARVFARGIAGLPRKPSNWSKR